MDVIYSLKVVEEQVTVPLILSFSIRSSCSAECVSCSSAFSLVHFSLSCVLMVCSCSRSFNDVLWCSNFVLDFKDKKFNMMKKIIYCHFLQCNSVKSIVRALWSISFHFLLFMSYTWKSPKNQRHYKLSYSKKIKIKVQVACKLLI